MASIHVQVKYKHGSSNPTTTATWSGYVAGQSESAVMAALQKKHPNHVIVIIEIDW